MGGRPPVHTTGLEGVCVRLWREIHGRQGEAPLSSPWAEGDFQPARFSCTEGATSFQSQNRASSRARPPAEFPPCCTKRAPRALRLFGPKTEPRLELDRRFTHPGWREFAFGRGGNFTGGRGGASLCSPWAEGDFQPARFSCTEGAASFRSQNGASSRARPPAEFPPCCTKRAPRALRPFGPKTEPRLELGRRFIHPGRREFAFGRGGNFTGGRGEPGPRAVQEPTL